MKFKLRSSAKSENIGRVQTGRVDKPLRHKVTGAVGGIICQALTRHFPVGITPHLLRLTQAKPALPGVVQTLTKYCRLVGSGLLWACVIYDTYRIASVVTRDVRRNGRPGKNSAKKTAAIGSSWAVSTAGVYGGGLAGAWIGGGIGSIFGGVGAVPGATIGSLVGGLIGGVVGSFVGSTAGATAVDWLAEEEEGKMKKI